MKVTTVFSDSMRTVKLVLKSDDSLLYTITRYYDSEGFVTKLVRVFADGTINSQDFTEV